MWKSVLCGVPHDAERAAVNGPMWPWAPQRLRQKRATCPSEARGRASRGLSRNQRLEGWISLQPLGEKEECGKACSRRLGSCVASALSQREANPGPITSWREGLGASCSDVPGEDPGWEVVVLKDWGSAPSPTWASISVISHRPQGSIG